MRMCLICKKVFEKTHLHHISYELDNTVEVCGKCHRKIHIKTKENNLNKEIKQLLKPIDKSSVRNVGMSGKVEQRNQNSVQDVKDMIMIQKMMGYLEQGQPNKEKEILEMVKTKETTNIELPTIFYGKVIRIGNAKGIVIPKGALTFEGIDIG